MAFVLWDASALAKRYIAEIGSETVAALFDLRAEHTFASTPVGYAETYSILLRRHNQGSLSAATLATALATLQSEVIEDLDFGLLSITDEIIFRSIGPLHKHNLNSTDAAILTLLQEFAAAPGAPTCVLATSDRRLHRATEAEGFAVINPELTAAADISYVLSEL